MIFVQLFTFNTANSDNRDFCQIFLLILEHEIAIERNVEIAHEVAVTQICHERSTIVENRGGGGLHKLEGKDEGSFDGGRFSPRILNGWSLAAKVFQNSVARRHLSLIL